MENQTKAAICSLISLASLGMLAGLHIVNAISHKDDNTRPQTVYVGDIDGDSRPDVVIKTKGGSVYPFVCRDSTSAGRTYKVYRPLDKDLKLRESEITGKINKGIEGLVGK